MSGKTACCQFCSFACWVKGGRNGHERHSRENGNPFIMLEQALIWVPACAGTTLRPGFQPVANFFTRSCAGTTLRRTRKRSDRLQLPF